MNQQELLASVTRALTEKNYVGAYLLLRESQLDRAVRYEYTGRIAATVVDELSRTRRDDRERIYYLRSLLAWIFKDVPGLAALYREQLRGTTGGNDWLGGFARGVNNIGDVASGRKTVGNGLQDAADDAYRQAERAAEQFAGTETGAQVNEFLSAAERGIRDGIGQLGNFFRALNNVDEPSEEEEPWRTDPDRAAESARGDDVEDVSYEEASEPDSESASGPDDGENGQSR